MQQVPVSTRRYFLHEQTIRVSCCRGKGACGSFVSLQRTTLHWLLHCAGGSSRENSFAGTLKIDDPSFLCYRAIIISTHGPSNNHVQHGNLCFIYSHNLIKENKLEVKVLAKLTCPHLGWDVVINKHNRKPDIHMSALIKGYGPQGKRFQDTEQDSSLLERTIFPYWR